MVATGKATGEGTESIVPDNQFIKDVLRLGGKSAKKCFQCGTCTATCNVSYARNHDESFPRQQMLWTQWGLKDKVLRDPGIWACHQCNDCSAKCPRGAKPGDVLAATRALAIQHYSVPSFLAKVYAEPKYLPLIFGIPAIVLVALLYIFQGLKFPAGEVSYPAFIEDIYIEIAGALVVGAMVIGGALGILRFWRELRAPEPKWDSAPAQVVLGPGALTAVTPGSETVEGSFTHAMIAVAKHTDFQECDTDKTRFWGHLALFYGAPFLLFATAVAALYSWMGEEGYRAITHPVKITGNIGAALLLVGVLILAYNRFRAKPDRWGAASYFDWLLLWIIFLNVGIGIVVETARYANVAWLAYPMYMVHLIIVFASFVYAPYGKFAHSFYRLTAMTFIRQGGRSDAYRVIVLMAISLAIFVGIVAVLVGLGLGIAWLAGAI